MKPTDIQFAYMILILPTLFGLTLVGEGVYKILKARESFLPFGKNETRGWFSLLAGLMFIVLVALGYFFFFDKL